MYGYLTAGYMTAAYMQVLAPASLAYTVDTATFTKGTATSQNSPSYAGEAATSWSISPSLPPGMSFNTSTGVITGTPSAVVAEAGYTVTAGNDGGSTTKLLTFTVNDIAPSALSYAYTSPTYQKSTAITANSPSSSGGAVISYAVSPSLPAGLSLNTTTGVISGTPTVFGGASSYTVTATNTGGSTTAQVNITINDIAPSSMSYAYSSPTYSKNSAITENAPSSSGGSVVSYSVSPALPSGLSLNESTGVISGTPSVFGAAADYTVTATNSGGSTTAVVNIAINDVAPSSLSYAYSAPTYSKNQAISANSPSSSGGAVVSYSVSPALPSGLSLSTSSGVISGTPTVFGGPTSYTVTATNSGGSTTASVSITINDIAPSSLVYSSSPMSLIANAGISPKSPSISGGAVTSWSVSPSLPDGLSFNTGTGVITGTPTAVSAQSSYTVTAANTGGSVTTNVLIAVTTATPLVSVPQSYTSGQKVTLNMSRSVLQSLPKVANHPILSEQNTWHKVSAVFVNENVPYGDTDRIVGLGFKGAVTLAGKFRAQAESGDTYKLKTVQIRDVNNNRLRIEREDIESPEALDISVS